MIDAITNCSTLDLQKHEHAVRNAVKRKEEEQQMDRDESIGLLNTFSAKTQHCIMRKLDFKCSGWLSIIPTLENHFDINPDEFHDYLRLDMCVLLVKCQAFVMEMAMVRSLVFIMH